MEIEAALKERAERFFRAARPSMLDTLGIELLSLSRAKVTARMPVDHRTHQPRGILHGGASVALAETVISIGGAFTVEDERTAVVGLEINANHIRPVERGYVTATATPLHLGRSTQVWQALIENEEHKLVCAVRCTLAVVPSGPRT